MLLPKRSDNYAGIAGGGNRAPQSAKAAAE